MRQQYDQRSKVGKSARSVDCPTCEAESGAECVNVRGRRVEEVAVYVHRSRVARSLGKKYAHMVRSYEVRSPVVKSEPAPMFLVSSVRVARRGLTTRAEELEEYPLAVAYRWRSPLPPVVTLAPAREERRTAA